MHKKEERLMACRTYSKAVEYCWLHVDLMGGADSGNCQLSVNVARLRLCPSPSPLPPCKGNEWLSLTITASHRLD